MPKFIAACVLISTLGACGLGTDTVVADRAKTDMLRFSAAPVSAPGLLDRH